MAGGEWEVVSGGWTVAWRDARGWTVAWGDARAAHARVCVCWGLSLTEACGAV